MSGGDDRILELADDASIVPVLEQDRVWAAYALCDLEPPQRAHARYIGRSRNGYIDAVVLVYAPPGFTSLLPCGARDGIALILAQAQALPKSAVFLARRADLPAVARRYQVDAVCAMLRFVLSEQTLRPSRAVDAEVRRLTSADLPRLQELYTLWPDTVFAPSMFDPGVYYGAFRDDVLVAAAGTHAVSLRYRAGVIGNVFTHPAHRGCGLATAATGAVARTLLQQGVREVTLNVREDNAAAVAAYSRLGFTLQQPFWEGSAALRQHDLGRGDAAE